MSVAAISSADKLEVVAAVGRELRRRPGPRPVYSIEEVQAAFSALAYPPSWLSWALAEYCDEPSFRAYHRAEGILCSYAGMRASLAAAVERDRTDIPYEPPRAIRLFTATCVLSVHIALGALVGFFIGLVAAAWTARSSDLLWSQTDPMVLACVLVGALAGATLFWLSRPDSGR